MGSGVEAHETFEALVEDRLNKEFAQGTSTRFEILNFGVAGYTPFHVLYQLDRKVFAFEPHLAIFVIHARDWDSAAAQFVRMVRRRFLPRDPYLEDLVRRTGLTPQAGLNEGRRRVKPFEKELLGLVYGRFVELCRARGIIPVFLYMQPVTEPAQAWRKADRIQVLTTAREAGGHVLDLTGVFEGRDLSTLSIAENDGHPNALGSRLIADKLHRLLHENRDALSIPLRD
jgi:hypothetical protein